MTSISYGVMAMLSIILPNAANENPKSPDVLPYVGGQPSTVSPTLIGENTLDSKSTKSQLIDANPENLEDENLKLTAWIQSTITKLKIEILSHYSSDIGKKLLYTKKPKLKLVFEAEDIVSSLDFQNVYLKIKSKIGSASIRHFQR